MRYLFPTYCPLCRSTVAKGFICALCADELSYCHQALFRRAQLECHAVFHYTAAIQHMLMQLKFSHKLIYTRFLGNELARALRIFYTSPPLLLLPVPLHNLRLKERGFNQVLEIAKVAAKQLNIRIDKNSIVRTKYTKAQTECTLSERKQNIKNAFSMYHTPASSSIILLDDVITTGSTVRECYNILKSENRQVDIWCIAKAD